MCVPLLETRPDHTPDPQVRYQPFFDQKKRTHGCNIYVTPVKDDNDDGVWHPEEGAVSDSVRIPFPFCVPVPY